MNKNRRIKSSSLQMYTVNGMHTKQNKNLFVIFVCTKVGRFLSDRFTCTFTSNCEDNINISDNSHFNR